MNVMSLLLSFQDEKAAKQIANQANFRRSV